VGWERYAIDGIHSGNWPPLPDGVTDILSFNDYSVATRQTLTWEAVWTEFGDTRWELQNLIAYLSQSDVNGVFGDPQRPQTMYQWLLIWLHHELEHSAELRVALDLPDIPSHLTRISAIES
jgi:hypothetical protein